MGYKRIKTDLIYSTIFIMFCLFMIAYAIPTEIASKSLLGGDDIGVDSRTLPYMCSWTILAIAGFQWITSFIKLSKVAKMTSKEEKKLDINWKLELFAFAIFALYIVYAVLMDSVGFIISSLIMPVVVLFVLKDRDWKHFVAIEILAVLLFVLARYGLGIILP